MLFHGVTTYLLTGVNHQVLSVISHQIPVKSHQWVGFSCLRLNPHVETPLRVPSVPRCSPLPDYDAQSASTERGKRHLSGRSLGLKLEAQFMSE